MNSKATYRIYYRKMFTAILLLGMLTSGGCAVQLIPAAIAPDYLSPIRHEGSVALTTEGGVVGGLQLSPRKFYLVHYDALTKSRVFNRVVEEGAHADYYLNVRLINIRSPVSGGDMTGTVSSGWKLERVGGETYEETFTTSSTATMGDAFVGVTRSRIVIEGALRESIKAGLTWLSEIDLGTPPPVASSE